MCHPYSKNEILCDAATQKATKDEVEFSKNKPEKFVKNSDAIETFTVSRLKRAVSKPFSAPLNIVLFLSFFLSFFLFLFQELKKIKKIKKNQDNFK